MHDYFWRIPTVLGVMACSGLFLFAVAVVSSILIARWPSRTSKLAAAVIFVVAALLTRIPIRATAALIAAEYEISIGSVEPSRLRYLLPVMFAGFAFVVGKWVLPDGWTNRRALLFYAWVTAFTAANVVNRCSPGWCGTIGFPFAWEHWSDNIMTGDSFGDFMDTAGVIYGAVADLLTFVLIAAALVRPRILRRSA